MITHTDLVIDFCAHEGSGETVAYKKKGCKCIKNIKGVAELKVRQRPHLHLFSTPSQGPTTNRAVRKLDVPPASLDDTPIPGTSNIGGILMNLRQKYSRQQRS